MFVIIGAILGALSVIIGAFGAHILETALTESDFATFQTAVKYQMYHSILLLIIGIWKRTAEINSLQWAGVLILTGIILFCGSLYLIVFTGIRAFGAVAPFGGLFLISGWLYLAYIAYKFN